MKLAIEEKRINTMKWMHKNTLEQYRSNKLLGYAALEGDIDLCKWMKNEGYKVKSDKDDIDLCHLIRKGHKNIIQWLVTSFVDAKIELSQYRSWCMSSAIAGGHIEIVKYLFSIFPNSSFKDCILEDALHFEQLDIAKYIYDKGYIKFKSTYPLDNAVQKGNFELLKWSYEQGFRCSNYQSPMDIAAKDGRLDILKLLHQYHPPGSRPRRMCTKYAMDWAALEGHFEIVKWLHENRPEGCSKGALTASIRLNYLDITRFLFENRLEGFDIKDSFFEIIFNGSIDMFILVLFHYNSRFGQNKYKSKLKELLRNLKQYSDDKRKPLYNYCESELKMIN